MYIFVEQEIVALCHIPGPWARVPGSGDQGMTKAERGSWASPLPGLWVPSLLPCCLALRTRTCLASVACSCWRDTGSAVQSRDTGCRALGSGRSCVCVRAGEIGPGWDLLLSHSLARMGGGDLEPPRGCAPPVLPAPTHLFAACSGRGLSWNCVCVNCVEFSSLPGLRLVPLAKGTRWPGQLLQEAPAAPGQPGPCLRLSAIRSL